MSQSDVEVSEISHGKSQSTDKHNWNLSARLEPFDSYWQAPDDIEQGYSSFYEYYRQNYLPQMPHDKACTVLVISCGPGYLVETLKKNGYTDVLGIDSDPDKIAHARQHELNCKTAEAFPFLADSSNCFDVIIPEQELNHLTISEQITFLKLCHNALRDGGTLIAYGLNGANPFVGAENLAHNIDHFNTFTEYSLQQIIELGGFSNVRLFPLKIYVFWKNPLNYAGLFITGAFELICRIMFKLYGKNVKILSKKVAAVASK